MMLLIERFELKSGNKKLQLELKDYVHQTLEKIEEAPEVPPPANKFHPERKLKNIFK